jgi:hypothetical protein
MAAVHGLKDVFIRGLLRDDRDDWAKVRSPKWIAY